MPHGCIRTGENSISTSYLFFRSKIGEHLAFSMPTIRHRDETSPAFAHHHGLSCHDRGRRRGQRLFFPASRAILRTYGVSVPRTEYFVHGILRTQYTLRTPESVEGRACGARCCASAGRPRRLVEHSLKFASQDNNRAPAASVTSRQRRNVTGQPGSR